MKHAGTHVKHAGRHVKHAGTHVKHVGTYVKHAGTHVKHAGTYVKHAGITSLSYMCRDGCSLAPRLLGSGVGGAYSSGSVSVLDIEGSAVLNTILKVCEHRLWN